MPVEYSLIMTPSASSPQEVGVLNAKLVLRLFATWTGDAMESTAGGDGLRIEEDPVRCAALELDAIAAELREGMRQVVAAANDVVDASWRGEAASAFRSEFEDFQDAARLIVDDAETIAGLVSYSVNLYASEDSSTAAVLRSVWVDG